MPTVAYTRTASGLRSIIIQQMVVSNMFWLKVSNNTGRVLRNQPLWLESHTHTHGLWMLYSITKVSLTFKRQAKPKP